MTDKTSRKAVIYTRIAIRGAFDERAGQEKRCSDYAAQQGYTIIESFADYGSGNMADRPGITAMIGFLAGCDTPPPTVIIDDIVRLARDLAVFDQLREAIRLTGSEIVCPSMQEEAQL